MKKYQYKFILVYLFILSYPFLIIAISQYEGFYVLQWLTARTIYFIQSLLGINVVLDGATLIYSDIFSLRIDLLCTGIGEMLFFFLLLLGFRGVSFKTKLKGYAVFFPIIIMENLGRITIMQPLMSNFGKHFALNFHNFLFKYGQLVFVVILAVAWFQFFAKKEFKKVQKQEESS